MVNFTPFVLLFLLNTADCYSLKRIELGQPCADTQECQAGLGGALSECVANEDGDKVCQCTDDAVPVEVGIGFICDLKATNVGDPCQADSQCKSNLGALSECCDLICVCKADATASPDGKYCLASGILIGESCTTDSECVAHSAGTSVCTNRICSCKSEYVPSNRKDSCLPIRNQIGESCEENPQCQAGPLGSLSGCSASKVCECLPEAIAAPEVDTCLRKATLVGEACEVDIQCTENLGALSLCSTTENKCECKPGAIPNDDMTACVEPGEAGDVHIGSPCETDTQCVGNPGTTSQCFSGICSCMTGYIASSNLEDCLEIRNNLGEPCVENDQCRQGRPGRLSMCAGVAPQPKVCNCIPAAIAEPGNNVCRRKATFVGDTCLVQSQCLAHLGYSRCSGGFCLCLGGAIPFDNLSGCHN